MLLLLLQSGMRDVECAEYPRRFVGSKQASGGGP
jgi:hypothetical protein